MLIDFSKLIIIFAIFFKIIFINQSLLDIKGIIKYILNYISFILIIYYI